VPPAPAAMTSADFGAFLTALDHASFSSDKLAMIRTTCPHAWFTAAQVVRVLDELPHSTDKLEAAKALWPRIVDPQNGYLVYDALPFSSDKDALRKATAPTQY
jgi:hypothetical protein